MRGFFKRASALPLGVIAVGLGLQACGSRGLEETYNCLTVAAGGAPPPGSVLASADANLIIVLESNKDTTEFTIDGDFVGRGKYIKVWIADDRNHTVIAKPDLCDPKEELIHPPFRRDARIGFYYLRQDCPGECFPGMPCRAQAAEPAPPVTNAPAMKKAAKKPGA